MQLDDSAPLVFEPIDMRFDTEWSMGEIGKKVWSSLLPHLIGENTSEEEEDGWEAATTINNWINAYLKSQKFEKETSNAQIGNQVEENNNKTQSMNDDTKNTSKVLGANLKRRRREEEILEIKKGMTKRKAQFSPKRGRETSRRQKKRGEITFK